MRDKWSRSNRFTISSRVIRYMFSILSGVKSNQVDSLFLFFDSTRYDTRLYDWNQRQRWDLVPHTRIARISVVTPIKFRSEEYRSNWEGRGERNKLTVLNPISCVQLLRAIRRYKRIGFLSVTRSGLARFSPIRRSAISYVRDTRRTTKRRGKGRR